MRVDYLSLGTFLLSNEMFLLDCQANHSHQETSFSLTLMDLSPEPLKYLAIPPKHQKIPQLSPPKNGENSSLGTLMA
jgi:hypothetical protein